MNAVLVIVFALFAVAMWFHVAKRVAKGGWCDLAAKHSASGTPFGKKISGVSGRFPRSSYSSTLAIWLTPDGFFVRPVILFRSFHPALLIPWSSVRSVSEEKQFLSRTTVIECDVDGTELMLEVPGSHATEIKSHAPQTA